MDLLLVNTFTDVNTQRYDMAGAPLGLTPGYRPGSLRYERMPSPASSRDSRDELFFDAVSGAMNETVLPSYLVFEPVVESVSENETTDWRRYEPPQELLHFQENSNTSREIQGILAESIERIKQRHAEEEERRAAALRQERPIARVGRASVKPRLDVMRGALDPTHSNRASRPHRLSAGSDDSVQTNDSGYASETRTSPVSKKPRGLAGLFRRKEKVIAHQDPLRESSTAQTSPAPPQQPVIEERPRTPEARVPGSLTGECVSCLDDFATAELIKLSCHSYCSGCFERLISNALESETHWPAKCCLNPIPSSTILPHINRTMKLKYKQREDEWSIPTGDRIYCSQATCSTWIPPKKINKSTNLAICPKCNHKVCVSCRGDTHASGDCPQDPTLVATMNLAEMEGWKRCYSCQALVEHNKGCRHMTCRCKAQFCYICGLRWRTCACTDAQLANIQAEAEGRRQAATQLTAHQQREAEEVRIALQQVAEFEAAELERAERAAAAERRRVEEERRRREEERIAAVNRQFRQLTVELELLHDIQRVRIAERYELELSTEQRELAEVIETLSLRFPAEVQFLGTQSQKKISDAECKFEQEYQARLAEERRIEDDYIRDLRDWWRGDPEAEYKIREARDKLRANQDKEYKFWHEYRRKQLEAISETERRGMEALSARHQSEVKAVEGRWKIDEIEWKRKKGAEGRWVEEVVRERTTMMGEMEQREYARDV